MRHSLLRAAAFAAIAGTALPVYAVSHAELRQLAERYSQQLPRMVAQNVQEERMTFEALTLVYTYRHLVLPEQSFRSTDLAAMQRADILPKLCADPYTRRSFREGVTFRYRYLSVEGAVVGIVEFADRDCRGRC